MLKNKDNLHGSRCVGICQRSSHRESFFSNKMGVNISVFDRACCRSWPMIRYDVLVAPFHVYGVLVVPFFVDGVLVVPFFIWYVLVAPFFIYDVLVVPFFEAEISSLCAGPWTYKGKYRGVRGWRVSKASEISKIGHHNILNYMYFLLFRAKWILNTKVVDIFKFSCYVGVIF